MEKVVIEKGEILSDSDKQRWIIGSFLGHDEITRYEAAAYDDKAPTDYPAMLQIVPYANEPLPIGFQFYSKCAKRNELDNWKRLRQAKYHLGIPVLRGEGSHMINDQNYKFIVIERHGKDLWSLFLENDKKFPVHTAYKIMLQMLNILKYIHSKSYFLNYISALNIVVDMETQNHIYFIDKYVAPQYIENNIKVALWSRDSHKRDQTERGDLEALFYNLVQWLGIKLPWEKNLENPSSVLKEKEDAFADVESWSRKIEIPDPVAEFMRLVGKMDSSSKPKYSDFTGILVKGLRELHYVPDGKLDFSISSVSNDKRISGDFNQVYEPQKSRKKQTTIPKLGISVLKIGTIISKNCRHEEEVKLREIGPDSLIETIYKLTSKKKYSKWQNILATAWEKNTAGIRTMTRGLWSERGLQANGTTNETASTENQHKKGNETPPQGNSVSLNLPITSPPNVSQILEDARSPSPFPWNGVQSSLVRASTSRRSSITADSPSEAMVSSRTFGMVSSPSDCGSSEVDVVEVKEEDDQDDDYELLNTWLDIKDQVVTDNIPSEPKEIYKQVKQLLLHCREFSQQKSKLRRLKKLPSESANAQKLESVEYRWKNLRKRLEKRGRELGEAILNQLRDALQDVSSKLEKLPLNDEPEEQLLETLARDLENVRRTMLTEAETAIDKLCRVLGSALVRSDLRDRFRWFKDHHEKLQKEINDKKVKIKTSLNDRPQFVDASIGACVKDGWAKLKDGLLKRFQSYEDVGRHSAEIVRTREDILEGERGKSARETQKSKSDNCDVKIKRSPADVITLDSSDENEDDATATAAKQFYKKQELFLRWLSRAESKLQSAKPASLDDIGKQLQELSALRDEVREKSEFEKFIGICDVNRDDLLKNELSAAKDRYTKLNRDLLDRLRSFEDINKSFAVFNQSLLDLQQKIEPYEQELASHDALEAAAKDSKLLHRVRKLESEMGSLLDDVRLQADDIVLKAREQGLYIGHLLDVVNRVTERIQNLKARSDKICSDILEQEYAKFVKEIQENKTVESRDSSITHSDRSLDRDSEPNSPRCDKKKSDSLSRKRSRSKESVSSSSRSITSSDSSMSHQNDKNDDSRTNSGVRSKKFKNFKDDLSRNFRLPRRDESTQRIQNLRINKIYHDFDRSSTRGLSQKRHWRKLHFEEKRKSWQAHRSNTSRNFERKDGAQRGSYYDSRFGRRSRSPRRNQRWDFQQKQPFRNITRENSAYGQATSSRGYRSRGWEPKRC